MNALFNSIIKAAEVVERPAQSSHDKRAPFVPHRGVRVELESGERYLIHNTPGNGGAITSAAGMSDAWRSKEVLPVYETPTVGEAMAAAHAEGPDYHPLLRNNRLDATKRVRDLLSPEF